MRKTTFLFYFLAIFLGLALNSCVDSVNNETKEFEITLDSPLLTNGEDFTCDNAGGTFAIAIKSTASRDVSSEINLSINQEGDWITAEIKDMQLILNIAEYNDKLNSRSAEITLTGDYMENYVSLYIVQTPEHVSAAYYRKLIYIGDGSFTDDGWHLNKFNSTSVFVEVMIFDDSQPVEIEFTSDCSWLSWNSIKDMDKSYITEGRRYSIHQCTISVILNDSGSQRTGHFTLKTSTGDEIGTYTVVQDYQTIDPYNDYVEWNGQKYPGWEVTSTGGNNAICFVIRYYSKTPDASPNLSLNFDSGWVSCSIITKTNEYYLQAIGLYESLHKVYLSVNRNYSAEERMCKMSISDGAGSERTGLIIVQNGATSSGGGGSSGDNSDSFTANASYSVSFTGGYESVLPISANSFNRLKERNSITVYKRSNGTYYISTYNQGDVTVSNGSNVLYASDTYQYKDGNFYRTATTKVYVKVWW